MVRSELASPWAPYTYVVLTRTWVKCPTTTSVGNSPLFTGREARISRSWGGWVWRKAEEFSKVRLLGPSSQNGTAHSHLQHPLSTAHNIRILLGCVCSPKSQIDSLSHQLSIFFYGSIGVGITLGSLHLCDIDSDMSEVSDYNKCWKLTAFHREEARISQS